MVQTAEGNLDEVHSMLQRVRELAVQYKNGTLSSDDQAAIQSEVNQLASEIERIGGSAKFNGISLLDRRGTVTFQVGANDGDVDHRRTISLGSAVGDVHRLSDAAALSAIDTAITPSPRPARRSARSRTASSTRWRARRSTRRT